MAFMPPYTVARATSSMKLYSARTASVKSIFFAAELVFLYTTEMTREVRDRACGDHLVYGGVRRKCSRKHKNIKCIY